MQKKSERGNGKDVNKVRGPKQDREERSDNQKQHGNANDHRRTPAISMAARKRKETLKEVARETGKIWMAATRPGMDASRSCLCCSCRSQPPEHIFFSGFKTP